MGRVPSFFQIHDGHPTNIAALKPRFPLSAVLGAERLAQKFDCRPMAFTSRSGDGLNKLWALKAIEELFDKFVLAATQRDVTAIFDLIDVQHRVAAMRAFLQRLWRLSAGKNGSKNVRRRVQHRLEHADVDVVALAGLMAAIERHHDPGKREVRGQHVRTRDTQHCRAGIPFGGTAKAQNTCSGNSGGVMCRTITPRSVLAKRRH